MVHHFASFGNHGLPPVVFSRYRLAVANLDERIGKNLARYRGDMSQRELANRVRDAGMKWTHLTVASVERGERPLRAAESVLLMQILGIPSFDALLSNEDSTRLRMLMSRTEQDMLLTRSAMIRLMQHQQELMAEIKRIETESDYSELDEDVVVEIRNFDKTAKEFAEWLISFGDTARWA